ncbi:MAG: B12-binding domain-containing radical SAM protein [Promethearchaeota archaeon]
MIDVCLVNFRTEKEKSIKDGEKKEFTREPPNGILVLASILEEYNFSVEILDCSLIENPFDFIRNNAKNYRLFGFTALTNTFYQTIQLMKTAKRFNPYAFIIGGGPHLSFTYHKDLIKYPFIDAICVGEAERSFPWLVEKLLTAPTSEILYYNEYEKLQLIKNYPGKIQKLLLDNNSLNNNDNTNSIQKGIAFLSKPIITPFIKNLFEKDKELIKLKDNIKNWFKKQRNIKVIFSGFPDPVPLETIPLPARHLIELEYDVADVIINRGCPNNCSFCVRNRLFPKTRLRPLKSVIEELNYIKNYPNYRFVNFYDNINLNSNYFENFLNKLIEINFPLPWGAEIRADTLTPYQASLMAKANCKIIATGIESADENVLKLNFKYQNPLKVKKGIELLKKAGIAIQAYFIIGLPGDTKKSFKKTLEYLKSLPLEKGIDKVNFFIATPYPGTTLFNSMQKLNLKLINYNYNLYNCKNIIFETSTLKKKDIKNLIKKARITKERLGLN